MNRQQLITTALAVIAGFALAAFALGRLATMLVEQTFAG